MGSENELKPEDIEGYIAANIGVAQALYPDMPDAVLRKALHYRIVVDHAHEGASGDKDGWSFYEMVSDAYLDSVPVESRSVDLATRLERLKNEFKKSASHDGRFFFSTLPQNKSFINMSENHVYGASVDEYVHTRREQIGDRYDDINPDDVDLMLRDERSLALRVRQGMKYKTDFEFLDGKADTIRGRGLSASQREDWQRREEAGTLHPTLKGINGRIKQRQENLARNRPYIM